MKSSWPSLMLLWVLTACSYSYPVDAVFIGGKLHFQAKDKLNGCLSSFRVESEHGEVMWEILGDFRHSPCRNNFPIAYGDAPDELRTVVAAKPLEAGILYKIEGSDGERYYGAFRYHRRLIITNAPEVARAF